MAGRYDPYDFNANAPILSPLAPEQMQATPLQPSKALTQNPQLSDTPLGAYTDSQYEAAVAQLRAQIQKQYADVLQQIGYKNDAGEFIPGQVEADAQKQTAELNRSMGLAGEEVTQQHQREGTLFSGLRGINTGRAQHPFVSAISDLATSTPLTLAKLYDQGTGLTDDYMRQNNLLLADAAARAAAGFGTQPGQVVSAPVPPVPGGISQTGFDTGITNSDLAPSMQIAGLAPDAQVISGAGAPAPVIPQLSPTPLSAIPNPGPAGPGGGLTAIQRQRLNRLVATTGG